MACGETKSITKNELRQPPEPKEQGKRPQGIKKQQAVRESARLQAIGNLDEQPTPKSNHIREVQTPPSPPASNIPEGSGNKGKKNKKLNIPLLGSETSLLQSEFELSLRVVLEGTTFDDDE